MARTFDAQKLSVPDNDADVGGTITTWLNGLSIGSDHTVYSVNVMHVRGFYEVIVIYEP